MCTNSQQQSQVDAKSSDISSGLAADPENTQVTVIVEFVVFALVDGTDTELALDSGNQWWALEQSTSQGLEGASELSLATWDFVVKSDNADVFLSGTLLRLDETGGTIDTDDETSSDLRIQCTAVTSLLHSKTATSSGLSHSKRNVNSDGSRKVVPQNSLHPRDNLMTGRVRRLIQVDHTRANEGLQITLERRATGGDRSEMAGPDKNYIIRTIVSASSTHRVWCAIRKSCTSSFLAPYSKEEERTFVIVLQKQRPLRRGNRWGRSLWLDGIFDIISLAVRHGRNSKLTVDVKRR